MQSTSSVAQGSFLFLPEGFSLSKLKKSKKRKLDDFSQNKWETAFKNIWDAIDQEIREINQNLFSKILEDLIKHMEQLHNDVKLNEGVIPCEILLTGTNLPDHKLLLSTLIDNINKKITPLVSVLWSWSCGNIKSIVQNLISQIIPISKRRKKDASSDEDDDGDESCDSEGESNENNKEFNSKIHLQMSQYNFSTLSSWYDTQCQEESQRKPVIIIIPDFESFIPNTLGEFILLLSAYSSRIPFILVFGVATTPVAVYQNLPRKVLSQLVIQLFRSEPSTSLLNNVIQNVLFSERYPFRLGSKCMTFLTDIFLFHSFSVHSFVQGFKYCLMEHFYKRSHFALCCSLDAVDEAANSLSKDEIEAVRKLSSFQKFVEKSSLEDRKTLLLDDDCTKVTVAEMVKDVLNYTRNFHIVLKCLHVLTHDLPKSPLGRNIREYYCKAVSSNISESQEYSECMKLLELQSQNELVTKISNLIQLLNTSLPNDDSPSDKSKKLRDFLVKLEEFKKLFDTVGISAADVEEKTNPTDFESLRKTFWDYIHTEIVANLLSSPINLPLHEVIYFDDLSAIRRRISGSPRGAIHLALNNPQCYLNCKCCVLSSPEAILPTMPDLSIAYKLHLECNKIINMYDWLQSFAASVQQESENLNDEIHESGTLHENRGKVRAVD